MLNMTPNIKFSQIGYAQADNGKDTYNFCFKLPEGAMENNEGAGEWIETNITIRGNSTIGYKIRPNAILTQEWFTERGTASYMIVEIDPDYMRTDNLDEAYMLMANYALNHFPFKENICWISPETNKMGFLGSAQDMITD